MFDMLHLPSSPAPGKSILLSGLPESYEAFVLAQLMMQNQLLVHVARDESRLKILQSQLTLLRPDLKVLSFPAWDCLPYDRVSPSKAVVGERLETLSILAQPLKEPTLVLTTVAAYIQRLPRVSGLTDQPFSFMVGQTLDLIKLGQMLTNLGYRRMETVREPAEFAIRGGLVDLFPGGEENPYRLDLFGDEIESIRRFDPLTQRSLDKVEKIELHPASEVLLNPDTIRQFRAGFREFFPQDLDEDPLYQAISEGHPYPGMEHWLPLFYPEMQHLLDYLPSHTVVSYEGTIQQAFHSRFEQIQEYYQARLQFAHKNSTMSAPVYRPLPPHLLYLQPEDLEKLPNQISLIQFTPFKNPKAAVDLEVRVGLDFAAERAQSQLNLIEVLIQRLRELLVEDKRVAIACISQGSAERLGTLLREHHFSAWDVVPSWQDIFKGAPSKVNLIAFELEQGFTTPFVTVISEQDIFGERHTRVRKKRRRADLFVGEASSLNPGDYVVHVDHGIGRYEGLHTLKVDQVPHDCVCLIYEGGDKLFVPVENLELLSRYGGEDSSATVDRLGSTAWQGRKARIKKKLFEIADHLLKLAAERQLQRGVAFDTPEALYDEFIARFAYSETDDQLRAIEETLEDLASGRPMDRLICGDVGFGKTEVALRAAFVVAAQGKQVAVIAPTTLLCRQHYRNFVERFKGFGLRLGHLSRLVSAKDTKLTKDALARGEIDVVVGTHGLLSTSTKFKDLGLVIIDEEQHFGVKQKERLKEIQANVHILTLSATPIPRTLQMALSGVKDMSLIATPPIDRLAVRTFVLPYDPVVIREAIMREHFRGGQIFYVCPRIEDLSIVADELKELVPEIKVAVMHGQMPASAIETLMLDFYDQKFDLLLSTNIIESGLDLPSVNTIILHRSDLFGLAQLYQLRGRVGRTKIRAYAYLTIPNHVPIGSIAQRRLEVMQTLDTLGAGFQLASHDMDIRGTGNLLGAQQSGHIREVGVELYQQMLEEAITAIRDHRGDNTEAMEATTWVPQINIGLPILIPEGYVPDLSVRLSLYRRLSHLNSDEEMADFRVELVDRFGSPPQEVENLLEIMRLKQWCRKANIEKIDTGDKGAVISFYQSSFPNTMGLLNYIQQQKGTAFVRPDQRVVFLRSWHTPLERQKGVIHIVGELVKLATAH
jgi:transcription-repair coupling factor (superfamily II helicase)